MSSSSVCQGLQSCLEPRVMEPCVLRLKLALQQGSNFPQTSPSPSPTTNTFSLSPLSDSEENPPTKHECHKNDTKPDVASGWSFLQTLSHNKTEDQVYVHPTVKRSSSILSEKSLEMCTESLGSETGGNASESGDDMSLFSFDTNTHSTEHNNTTSTTITTTATHASYESKRVNRTCNLPPPLTTITDFGGVHVRPYREGGRLILEVVASPSPRPYFHIERGDGRLRLCLLESFSASDSDDVVCDAEEGVDEQEEENESEENREEEEEEEENESEKNRDEEEEKKCGEEDIISGVEEEEEELEERVENVEDEMGVKKLARPSRCKESGKRDIFGDALANLSFPRFLSVSE